MFLGLVQFVGHLFEQSSHVLLPVQHIAGLLVAFDVVLDLLLQVLVYSLVLENAEQALVDFAVEYLVFVGQLQVVFPQVLSLQGGLVELAFACPH